ncbi:hypothetical protein M8818_006997 [Zalaria obscura]|uniref:Uncharacterized protein n=1 Tax=Zalaria obscura TaxID=2024903 RepID=A0ACC3S4I6_9PEZI
MEREEPRQEPITSTAVWSHFRFDPNQQPHVSCTLGGMLRLQPTLVKVSREEIEETKVRLAEKQRTYAHRIPLACQQLAPSMIRIQPGPGRSRNGALVHADPARHIARSATTSDGPDCEPGTEASRAHSPIDSRGATTQDTKREITNASVQNPSQPRSSEHVHAHDNPARKECSSHQVGNRYPALLELDGSTEHTTASDGAPRRRRQIPRSAGSTSGSQSSVVILDPVAPPFVPRIRFGSADDGTRRQHPVRGYVNAVPSQNVRPQAAYTQNAPRQRRASGSRNNWPGNGRRRVENSSGHQQNHVPRIESTTVLDRYPVLIPLSGDAHSRLLPPQPSFTTTNTGRPAPPPRLETSACLYNVTTRHTHKYFAPLSAQDENDNAHHGEARVVRALAPLHGGGGYFDSFCGHDVLRGYLSPFRGREQHPEGLHGGKRVRRQAMHLRQRCSSALLVSQRLHHIWWFRPY